MAEEAAAPEWVQCDSCQKWRKLPAQVSAGSLPETFFCNLISWDPAQATCEAPEESWEQALESDAGDAAVAAAGAVPATSAKSKKGAAKSAKSATKKSSAKTPATTPQPASAPATTASKKRKRPIEWVQCENPLCGKWRQLAPNMSVSELPNTAWFCSMNTWTPQLASCEMAEESTVTKTGSSLASAPTPAPPSAAKINRVRAESHFLLELQQHHEKPAGTEAGVSLASASAAVRSSMDIDTAEGAEQQQAYPSSAAAEAAAAAPGEDAGDLMADEDAAGMGTVAPRSGEVIDAEGDVDVDADAAAASTAAAGDSVEATDVPGAAAPATATSTTAAAAAKKRKKPAAAAKEGGGRGAPGGYRAPYVTSTLPASAASQPLTAAAASPLVFEGAESASSAFVGTARACPPHQRVPAYVHGQRDYHHMLLLHPPETWAHPAAGGGVAADAVRAARGQVMNAGPTTAPPSAPFSKAGGGAHKVSYLDLVATAWNGKAKPAPMGERSHAALESNMRWVRSSLHAAPAATGRDHRSLLGGLDPRAAPVMPSYVGDVGGPRAGLRAMAGWPAARAGSALTGPFGTVAVGTGGALPESVTSFIAAAGVPVPALAFASESPASPDPSSLEELREAMDELAYALAHAHAVGATADEARAASRRVRVKREGFYDEEGNYVEGETVEEERDDDEEESPAAGGDPGARVLQLAAHMLLTAASQVLAAHSSTPAPPPPPSEPLSSLWQLVAASLGPSALHRMYRAGAGGVLPLLHASRGPRTEARVGGWGANHDAGHGLAVSDLDIVSESLSETVPRFSGVASGMSTAIAAAAERAAAMEASDHTSAVMIRLQAEWEDFEARREEREARRAARAQARADKAAARAAASTAAASAAGSDESTAASAAMKPDPGAAGESEEGAAPASSTSAMQVEEGEEGEAREGEPAPAEEGEESEDEPDEAPVLSPDDAVRRLRDLFGNPAEGDAHVISGDAGVTHAGHLWKPPSPAHARLALRERALTCALVVALVCVEALRQVADGGADAAPLPAAGRALARPLQRALTLVARGGNTNAVVDRFASAAFLSSWLSGALLPELAVGAAAAASAGGSGGASTGTELVPGATPAGVASVTGGLGPFALASRLQQLIDAGVAVSSGVPAGESGGCRLSAQAVAALQALTAASPSGAAGTADAAPAPPLLHQSSLGDLAQAVNLVSLEAALAAHGARPRFFGEEQGGVTAKAPAPGALAHMLPLPIGKPWRLAPIAV